MPVGVPTQKRDYKCENCDYVRRGAQWLDQDTKRLIVRRELGITPSAGTPTKKVESLEKEMEVLKESRDADRKEMQLIRQQLDKLVTQEIETVKSEAKDRDGTLFNLSQRVKELEDWRKFAEGNK
jgi:hypothetical protein